MRYKKKAERGEAGKGRKGNVTGGKPRKGEKD